jgi:DNA-binding PadR family transcriptional regulator
MKGDLIRGHLDLVLLDVLSRQPGHGYAVITALRSLSDGALDLAEGSVYPALHRLEDAGHVASDWAVVGGRRRRIYRITDDGSAALARHRRERRSLVSAVEAVLRAPRTVTA